MHITCNHAQQVIMGLGATGAKCRNTQLQQTTIWRFQTDASLLVNEVFNNIADKHLQKLCKIISSVFLEITSYVLELSADYDMRISKKNLTLCMDK